MMQVRRDSLWKSLDRLATLLVVAVGLLVAWNLLRPIAVGWWAERRAVVSEPVTVTNLALLGDRSARVGMVMFSCFECPYSAQFARSVWPEVKTRLVESGSLLVAFDNLPLPGHKNALKAAQSAECARQQGLFWPVHDRFFSGDVSLDRLGMWDELSALGLRMDRFKECINGPITARIDEEANVALSLGVQKTPAFAIGPVLPDGRIQPKVLLQGLRSFNDIKSAVESVR